MSTTKGKTTHAATVKSFEPKDAPGLVLYDSENPDAWIMTENPVTLVSGY